MSLICDTFIYIYKDLCVPCRKVDRKIPFLMFCSAYDNLQCTVVRGDKQVFLQFSNKVHSVRRKRGKYSVKLKVLDIEKVFLRKFEMRCMKSEFKLVSLQILTFFYHTRALTLSIKVLHFWSHTDK